MCLCPCVCVFLHMYVHMYLVGSISNFMAPQITHQQAQDKCADLAKILRSRKKEGKKDKGAVWGVYILTGDIYY